jgi:MFS family permease
MPKLHPTRALGFLIPEPGPQRVYSLSVLINTVGFGLVFTSMTLYLTRVVHLSAGQVGVGLTISGLVGLLASVPAGELADRRGPREMVRAAMFLECLAAACYLLIQNFWSFVLVTSLEMLIINAWVAADGALTRRVGGENATTFRSVNQAIGNLGISLGALGCGVAIQIGTPAAYRTLIIGNALTFLAGWAILRRLPHYETLPRPAAGAKAGARWVALTDKPFVAYTALIGTMSIQESVILLSLPLWVVDDTHAPRWSVSMFLLINTILVALFQVRVGRSVATITNAGAGLRRAGVAFLVSCTAIGFAAGLPSWAALLLLVGAVGLHTLGEMLYSSASFALDFGLAPAHAQGQYQGLVGVGMGAGRAAAPVLLVGLCLTWGRAGWLGLGAFFLALGLAGPALAGWGERTRPSISRPSEAELAITAD